MLKSRVKTVRKRNAPAKAKRYSRREWEWPRCGAVWLVIVQDLGVARIARAHFPHLRLHASTQMAVHNLAGVEMARQLGFRRVMEVEIPARPFLGLSAGDEAEVLAQVEDYAAAAMGPGA